MIFYDMNYYTVNHPAIGVPPLDYGNPVISPFISPISPSHHHYRGLPASLQKTGAEVSQYVQVVQVAALKILVIAYTVLPSIPSL